MWQEKASKWHIIEIKNFRQISFGYRYYIDSAKKWLERILKRHLKQYFNESEWVYGFRCKMAFEEMVSPLCNKNNNSGIRKSSILEIGISNKIENHYSSWEWYQPKTEVLKCLFVQERRIPEMNWCTINTKTLKEI